MGRQISPDFDKIIEGTDLNLLIKSKRAYNDINTLIKEASDKDNMPIVLENVERLKAMTVHFMKEALRLDGRLRFFQRQNQILEIENNDLTDENFLMLSQVKGREPYLRAKEMVDQYMKRI